MLEKLKDIFSNDLKVEENENGGKSYEVTVKSSSKEVRSNG